MSRFLLAIGIGCSLSDADCGTTIGQMQSDPQGKQMFGNMVLASAKNLPMDTGKWVMCDSMRKDPKFPSKYHLVTAMGSIAAPTAEDPTARYSHSMEIGMCLPAICTSEDIKEFLANKLENVTSVAPMFIPLLKTPGLKLEYIESHSHDEIRSPTVGCWISVAIVLFLTALIVVSTGLNIAAKNRIERHVASEGNAALLEAGGEASRPKPGLEKNLIFSSFSLVGENGTWDKLWQCPPYKDTDCLNGARVLSMFWVVLGHSFIMAEGIVGYENPQDIVQSPLNKNAAETNWAFMFVLNAQMSVDTFFFMGGFLFSLLTVKDLEKSRGKFPYVQALVLRYLRLTPSLAFVMLVYYQIWPYLASGPFAYRFQHSVYRRCDISWWSELTYTLNFIPFNSDDVCMGWTWYLGDDMIFFIVGILIVPLYYKFKTVAWATTGVLTLASLSITAWLVMKYHLAPEALDEHYQAYSLYAYSKPYTRIPTYFVGVAAAWVLLAMEKRGITKQTGWVGPIASTLLWIFAIGLTTTIVLIPATDHGYRKNTWSDIQSMIFLTFSRPMWGVCWAILTFLCYYGHAPITNGLLSHSFWTPFARLTYGAYLCHPLVIKLAGGCAVQYYTFSGMDLLYRMVGNTLLAYSASFAVWCYIERPMMTFTTAMIKSKRGGKGKPEGKQNLEKPIVDEVGSKPIAGK